MSARRKAREKALQVLYQLDLNHGLTPESALSYFDRFFEIDEEGGDGFTRAIVSGVASDITGLDQLIAQVSEHWRTDRMAVVDRNLLRMGVYELKSCDDIPATVTINEMIELAKQFGSEGSAAFINGILDKVKTRLHCPNKAP